MGWRDELQLMRPLIALLLLASACCLLGTPMFFGLSSGTISVLPPVTFSGGGGPCPQTVTLSCANTLTHIFYTVGNSGTNPVHTLDVETAPTVRIAASSGPVTTGGSGSSTKIIRAVAFNTATLQDSIITEYTACEP